MVGQIVALQGGLFTILSNQKAFQVRGAGLLRHHQISPTVGDFVEFEASGNITQVINQKNVLVRPRIANVDLVVLVISATRPQPSERHIYRFLASMEYQDLKPVIVLTKGDLQVTDWERRFTSEGYKVFAMDLTSEIDKKFLQLLQNHLVVLTGASGVGKSTLVAKLTGVDVLVGDISESTERGKQTTREVRIYQLLNHFGLGQIADSPGFSSFELDLKPRELARAFLDFRDLALKCKFSTCLHFHEPEPGCAVKSAVTSGKVPKSRYDAYLKLLQEVSHE